MGSAPQKKSWRTSLQSVSSGSCLTGDGVNTHPGAMNSSTPPGPPVSLPPGHRQWRCTKWVLEGIPRTGPDKLSDQPAWAGVQVGGWVAGWGIMRIDGGGGVQGFAEPGQPLCSTRAASDWADVGRNLGVFQLNSYSSFINCNMGTIIIHEHTRSGTGFTCTVRVTAHCPARKTGIGIGRIVPSAQASPTCQGCQLQYGGIPRENRLC